MLSFFAVGVAQQPMLVGVTLPAFSVHSVDSVPWNSLDSLACALAVSGLALAWTADDQLRTYMLANEQRVARGQKKMELLETGIWR